VPGAGLVPGVVGRGADVAERAGDVMGCGVGDPRGGILGEAAVELAQ
jgi:hypothetical protein